MRIYCTDRFKSEYEILLKNNSYKSLPEALISAFFKGTSAQIMHGAVIIGTGDKKVIKKRLAGSSGFRTYFYAYISKDAVYLSYVYPKTGSLGKQSLSTAFEKILINETADAIQDDNLHVVTESEGRLTFSRSKKS
ncbi:hypothetical protein SAMN04487996_10136 [Dyadobacter soli]|uniref:RelE toxin of RelE / RelB toxin-antitoxin system n=1 Tax=Dyadobacter soli TaxID=659014 RepID=A0A1G6UQF8_9BACT|nr:hypothetical protein SAMN04487996_10136 [Dyadobacter soli]